MELKANKRKLASFLKGSNIFESIVDTNAE
jgi:hypothetical protein